MSTTAKLLRNCVSTMDCGECSDKEGCPGQMQVMLDAMRELEEVEAMRANSAELTARCRKISEELHYCMQRKEGCNGCPRIWECRGLGRMAREAGMLLREVAEKFE